jgi:3D-(3,5/4)-trihydroxycyclohexane-1,2-dione acylhydrolase (decyclizing)
MAQGGRAHLRLGRRRQEIVTAVQEDIKLIIVLVQNHGFASIGAQRFGTSYPYRSAAASTAPVDLAANAESLGATVLRAATIDEFRTALKRARESTTTTVVHIETDPLIPPPPRLKARK